MKKLLIDHSLRLELLFDLLVDDYPLQTTQNTAHLQLGLENSRLRFLKRFVLIDKLKKLNTLRNQIRN